MNGIMYFVPIFMPVFLPIFVPLTWDETISVITVEVQLSSVFVFCKVVDSG